MQAIESGMNGTLNIEEDLMEFTDLSHAAVRGLLFRWYEGMRFTDEFQALPELLRKNAKEQTSDQWYYISSRYYLFANAMHRYVPFCGLLEPERFGLLVPSGGKVLDYAGGTGNAAFATQVMGYVTHYREISALQIAFTRFRAFKYKIPMVFHDWWEPLPPAFFDAVCFDSIGHVEDQRAELVRMTETLAPGGLLFLDVEDFDSAVYADADPRRYTPPVPEPSKCQSMHRKAQGNVQWLLGELGLREAERLSQFTAVYRKG